MNLWMVASAWYVRAEIWRKNSARSRSNFGCWSVPGSSVSFILISLHLLSSFCVYSRNMSGINAFGHQKKNHLIGFSIRANGMLPKNRREVMLLIVDHKYE